MGNRGNIVIEQDSQSFPSPVFFYTHWSGSEVKSILQAALKRGQPRWGDGQYLARIIFCEMIAEGDDLKSETGFGISTAVGGGEDQLIFANLGESKVRERSGIGGEVTAEWTFAEFIALDLGKEG